MERDDWARLIEALDAWTSASEIAPGQIESLCVQDETTRQVVIVMTPDQWDDMPGAMGATSTVRSETSKNLQRLQSHERFAVYSEYRSEPSTEPSLPEPPEFIPEPGGEWVAYDREGRIESRFAATGSSRMSNVRRSARDWRTASDSIAASVVPTAKHQRFAVRQQVDTWVHMDM